jgi:LacI family transcriptional regulator
MNVTIKDIARLSGVSYSTVSKALNDSPLVKPDTKKKILSVAQKLGYQPNIAAQSLVSKKSKTIGVLWPTVERAAVSSLATKINEELEKNGYSMILSINSVESAINLFNRFLVDGILVFDESVTPNHQLGSISSPAPVLCFGESGSRNIPSLDVNRKEAIYEAVNYLGGLGHKQISFIGDLSKRVIQQEKYIGFTKGIFDLGLNVHPQMAVDTHGLSWEDGYNATKELLASSYKPTAIVSASYDLTLGVIRALKELGLKIPHDLSLISYDNIPQLAKLEVPITACGAPLEKMAKGIVDTLLILINSNQSGSLVDQLPALKSELIVRSSCVPAKK